MFIYWDGSSWSNVYGPSPMYAHLHRVTGIASNDVWAIGNTLTSTLTLHWDGAVWNIVPSPNPSSTDNTLEDISEAAANDVWAVGAGYSYHWDGSHWNVVSIPIAPLGVDAI